MHVPSPLGSLQPWSPVGYTIVQIADEQVPTTKVSESALPAVKPRPVPNSPVGYRVVVVSDEQVPVTRRSRLPRPRWRDRPLPKRGNPWTILAIIGGVAALFLGPILLWTLTVTTWAPVGPMPMAQAVIPVEIQNVNLDAVQNQPGVQNLAEKPAPARDQLPQLAFPDVAKDQCVDCENRPGEEPGRKLGAEAAQGQPPDRENFGTQVQFVHNPQAAAKLAKEENKLTFLLHVSGNFEKDEFT